MFAGSLRLARSVQPGAGSGADWAVGTRLGERSRRVCLCFDVARLDQGLELPPSHAIAVVVGLLQLTGAEPEHVAGHGRVALVALGRTMKAGGLMLSVE